MRGEYNVAATFGQLHLYERFLDTSGDQLVKTGPNTASLQKNNKSLFILAAHERVYRLEGGNRVFYKRMR